MRPPQQVLPLKTGMEISMKIAEEKSLKQQFEGNMTMSAVITS